MDYQRVQRARKDGDVFAELYRENVTQIYHYLLSCTGNQQDAEDLTTQTFMAALESLSRFQKDASFTAWVMGIARHKYIDHLRRNHRGQQVSIDEIAVADSSSPDPEESAIQAHEQNQLFQVMNQLAPERAEALKLRIYGNLSAHQTGTIMGKTEGAVNNLVYRAIQDLKKWMKKDE